ncbi:Sodium/calcium exchanger protein-domain-containing protein [Fennellomyces sp. T-0311]|nr:Sodium/calcium exchanger protein-domain-containing protein [Fennellomyces sp. T-0311]
MQMKGMACRNSLSFTFFFPRIHDMGGRLFILLILSCFFLAHVGAAVPDYSPRNTSDLTALGHHHTPSCSNIETYEDQCAFVELACHGFSGMYLRFYYCSPLWKPITVTLLCAVLMLFFGSVSIVASDFFCPNLQTISSKLQLSESMAGVTVLAFGNGSPDLFSTFSAMNSGSGSLAVGELIGAAFFIVAIVSGSMGIIRPFKSKRITFMRDATFLTGAIIMMTWIVYHQRIYWYHGVGLVAYYLIYVSVVMLGSCNFQGTNSQLKHEAKSVTEELLDETSRLLGAPGAARQSKPPRLSIPAHGFATPAGMADYEHRLGHIIRPMTARSPSRHSLRMETSSLNMPRTTSTNGSISSRLVRHPMTPRVGIRTSLFGAIEFQQHVSAIRRANSSHHVNQPESAIRRRQISMPHWIKRSSPATSIPRGTVTGGRPRASTVTDTLRRGQQTTVTTPDSTNSSTGLAEDYFTYLSANQNKEFHGVDSPIVNDTNEFMIPEIRLAPPNNLSNGSSTTQDIPRRPFSCNSPIIAPTNNRTRSRGNSTSLFVPPSPSIANTEDEVFVSARQSPAVSPSPSMYDHRSISIVLSAADDYPYVQRTLDAQFARPASSYHIFSQAAGLIDSMQQTLFPTMQDWYEKPVFAKLSAFIAVPLVLVFTLTLPVAEPDDVKVDGIEVLDDTADDTSLLSPDTPAKNYLSVASAFENESMITADDMLSDIDMQDGFQQQEWCRWLLAVQAIFGSTFLAFVMALNEFIEPWHVVFGFAVGCMIAVFVMAGTSADKPPKWRWMLSFVGFFVALNWIFLLANNMVGLLKALGMVFNISDAILGLTVFALGNSIGDLVANTAIAKMGFPTMAISACYAGPLLNMVLGVGISSSYQIFKSGKPYDLDIAPTILVSSTGLITVLLSTLIVVNLNGYCINKKLGVWMIAVYIVCCIINVSLECLSE